MLIQKYQLSSYEFVSMTYKFFVEQLMIRWPQNDSSLNAKPSTLSSHPPLGKQTCLVKPVFSVIKKNFTEQINRSLKF